MGDKTGIEWTDATWNPIRGCSRVSEGCRNCYAESTAYRFSRPGKPYEGLAVLRNGHASWTGEIRFVAEHLLDPLKWKDPRRIFVNSMSDLFHEGVTDDVLDKIFAVMALSEQHIFQVLTKRPARMKRYMEMVASEEGGLRIGRAAASLFHGMSVSDRRLSMAEQARVSNQFEWHELFHVWLGVSVENQAAANERIPLLLSTPASIRFISAEPLLGPLDLRFWLNPRRGPGLDWVICGGESGPHARPMNPDWARSLRDQCREVGTTSFFFKQWGEWAPTINPAVARERGLPLDQCMSHVGKKAAGALLDGREWHEFPIGVWG